MQSMTIEQLRAASNAGGKHLALLERGIIIRLFDVADLAVGMIGGARVRLDRMGLRQ